MTITVNVSDAQASADPRDMIVTHSLGSCIGVCLYDENARVAGMLHFQLPSSELDPGRARMKPAMFADSGLQLLLAQMGMLGASSKNIKVKLAGGATILNDAAMFNIGKRNHAAIRKALWQQGLFIQSEDVGGSAPRTIYFAVADGALTIKCGGVSKVA